MAQSSAVGKLTVKDAFAELLRRIELNDTRVALASQRYNAVKKTLETNLPGKTVKQIGSFQRKTKVRPQDLSDALDVDALVIFGSFTAFARAGEGGMTPANALQTVRAALVADDTYRIMQPKQDSPVVVLEYADDFKIELVPAYIDKTGQHDHGAVGIDCYIVPDAKGNWPAADYDYDAAVISATNQRADVAGMLIPFIKIAKVYLRTTEVPLKSFHIEILATLIVSKAIATWSKAGQVGGYNHLLAEFLSNAPALLGGNTILTMGYPMPVILPGSFSPATDSGLGVKEIAAVVDFMKKRGEAAWKICAMKDEAQAVAAWRDFIGDPFPAQ